MKSLVDLPNSTLPIREERGKRGKRAWRKRESGSTIGKRPREGSRERAIRRLHMGNEIR
jgi:hypothetical protein